MSETTKTVEVSADKGVKRKKKRSAMQMAKKYARSSERGHGTELDSDTYQYMVRILDILRQDFATMDEKLIFVNNVYEQTIGREIEYARNQVGSRVLDSLLEYANYEVVQRLADALNGSLRPICNDRFASHVLEKIIHVCADRGNKIEKSAAPLNSAQSKDCIEIADNEIEKYNNIALKFCRYVVNNFEEFVWDTYANHVLRTVVECLGGVLDKDEPKIGKKQTTNFEKRRSVVPEYTNLLVDLANRFLKWPQFLEFGKDELTSGLLQTILYTLKGVDSKLNSRMIKTIINDCFTENTKEQLSTIFHTESSVRLLEVCLAVAKSKRYKEICQKLFVERLAELSLMSGANFAVQRLFDNCQSKEELENIFDELSSHFAAILGRRNTGIFASIANACTRLQCRQGPFVNLMMKTLGCEETQLMIVPAIVALENCERVVESRREGGAILAVHLHGSITLQAMLRFNKPIKIVNSLLDMRAEEIVALFSDPKGSRILDAFMESKFIGEKSREKLAKNLQGHWVSLACGIHGSRCLDKIWEWSKTTQRMWIMDELARVGESLNSTKTGKLISAKLNVTLYGRNKKDWANLQGKQEKTKALFANIIDTAIVKKEDTKSLKDS